MQISVFIPAGAAKQNKGHQCGSQGICPGQDVMLSVREKQPGTGHQCIEQDSQKRRGTESAQASAFLHQQHNWQQAQCYCA